MEPSSLKTTAKYFHIQIILATKFESFLVKMAQCKWKVPLGSGNHVVEFSHGTTSGSRVVKVDGQIKIKRDWMFRLVGEESFPIGPKKIPAKIRIEAIDGFTYTYKLFGGDKELQKFAHESKKNLAIWPVRGFSSIFRQET